MNVVVTGAHGFLGGRVVDALRSRGCVVTELGRRDGDLTDDAAAARALSPWRWDVAINLAGPVTGGNESFEAGLVVARAHSQIALNVRRHAHGRVVHASSTVVYGSPQQALVREDHPLRPAHLYGLGKVLAEDVLADAIVLRFGGLFGERRRSGALFHFCRAAHEGAPLRVTTPTPTPWDILHVDDAAEAIARAATLDAVPTGPINIGYGEPIELGAIAKRIAKLGGDRSTVEVTVEHPAFHLDVSRARRQLGWNPPSLDDRLAALYAELSS